MGGPAGGVTDPVRCIMTILSASWVQNTCPPPKPYRTLDDENSYSPGRNQFD